MNVLKFGGTSVGSPARIEHVADLIEKDGKNITVLSAMAGTTNSLVEISEYLYKGNIPGAQETINALEAKYYKVLDELFADTDPGTARQAVVRTFALLRSYCAEPLTDAGEKEILAQGELLSTAIMHRLLTLRGKKVVLLPALDFMRTLPGGEPDMKHIATRLRRLLELEPDADIFLTQGYICRNDHGGIDNLKRGGSDYTASIIGAVIEADEIQIWTDIDGMHNNDPRVVDHTEAIPQLNFEEAAELAYFGAKILHPTCVQPAKFAGIPVRLKNTMEPEAPGTIIDNVIMRGKIKAVAAKDNITAIKIKSSRMLLATGFLRKVFEIFESYQTPIDMVATSEVGVSMSIDNATHLTDIVDELKKYGTVTVDTNMCIVCVVGDLDWSNLGFETLATDAMKNIPVRMISYGGSNYNISFLIKAQDKQRALQNLSDVLFK